MDVEPKEEPQSVNIDAPVAVAKIEDLLNETKDTPSP